jgi:hypothetical protein
MLLPDSDSRFQLAREHAERLAEEMRRSRRLTPDMAGLPGAAGRGRGGIGLGGRGCSERMALRARRSSSLGARDGPISVAGQTGDSEPGGSGRERRMPLSLESWGVPAFRRRLWPGDQAGRIAPQLSLFLSTAAAPRWFQAVPRLSRSISRQAGVGRHSIFVDGFASSHSRNAPTKALSFAPSRAFGGKASSFFAFPPPSTT